MKKPPLILITLFLVSCLSLGACGQKGPLIIEEPTTQDSINNAQSKTDADKDSR